MMHPAIGNNRYCGPGALAILTGLTTDESARTLRRLTGKRAIKAVYNHQMLRAMRSLGCVVYDVPLPHRMTLQAWMQAKRYDQTSDGVYLVCVTGHYVVCRPATGEVCDNKTVYPIHISKFNDRRKRIKHVWRIHKEQ